MKKDERLVQTIFRAVDEFNQDRSGEEPLGKSMDTALFGESGRLDSLGLVNLIVLIEQEIEEEYGLSITIADERAMSQKRSPFRTIRSLAEYLSLLLKENEDG
jgi:acyl carrier protein